jgi:cation transport ATPase
VLQVVHLEAYAGFSVPDVLMSAAGAERGSAHPLAAALVGAAAAAAADTGLPAANMRSLQGKVSAAEHAQMYLCMLLQLHLSFRYRSTTSLLPLVFSPAHCIAQRPVCTEVQHTSCISWIQGVLALVGGRAVAVGNSRLLAGQGVRLTEKQVAEEAAWQAKGASVIIAASFAAAAGVPVCGCLKCSRPGQ